MLLNTRRLDASLAAGLLALVVVTVGMVGARDWTKKRPARRAQPPERVDDWRAYAVSGHRVGPAVAPVVITVFSDFQCPFCRRAFGALRAVRAKHPGEVAVIYRQFPLKGAHPFAYAAALASECAAAQGRFIAYQRSLFERQAQLSQDPYRKVAHDVGVRDSAAFSRCLRDSAYAGVVRADEVAGRKLGVRSTPTILVNSLRLHQLATADMLEALVASEMKDVKASH